jgi:hypothetical protein
MSNFSISASMTPAQPVLRHVSADAAHGRQMALIANINDRVCLQRNLDILPSMSAALWS